MSAADSELFDKKANQMGCDRQLRCACSQMLASYLLIVAAAASAADTFPVAIRVDAAQTKGELQPIWRFFGADEPNYAYLKNGQKLVAELGELRPKQVFFRAHN